VDQSAFCIGRTSSPSAGALGAGRLLLGAMYTPAAGEAVPPAVPAAASIFGDLPSLGGCASTASGSGSSLFTFGAAGAGAAPSGASGSSIFGAVGNGGASPPLLFGGTGGGLFSGSASGPLFGGTSSGAFSFGTTAVSSAPRAEAGAEGEESELIKEEEEEVTQVDGWAPSVTIELKSALATGEEDEREVYCQRSKLYRWRDGESWKERGLGEAKLLQNKESSRIRFLMRQEKTGKVAANHFVFDDHPTLCQLVPNAESEKIWVWAAQDYSDGPPEVVSFGLKFGTVELAAKFKEAFDDAKKKSGKAPET